MASDSITIKGAREHNLKGINVRIPRDTLTVITGVSGSGKSSLAFDTLYAEGQRRYVESLSAYARQFLEQMDKPEVDSIEGLSPAISIEQKTVSRNPRSTVGTVTEIYDYLRLLFARIGVPYCYQCEKPIQAQSSQQIIDALMEMEPGTRLTLLAPVVRGRKGEYRKELEEELKGLQDEIDELEGSKEEVIKGIEEGFAEEKAVLLDELNDLDAHHHQLMSDLKANPDDGRVINALIRHYQIKLEVMDQIIIQLNQIKSETSENYENESI